MNPMTDKRILVVTKLPGERPETQVMLQNDFAAIQSLVGEPIETVMLEEGIVLICNEEGRQQGLAPNVCLRGQTFFGPVLVTGAQLNEFTRLSCSQVDRVTRALETGASMCKDKDNPYWRTLNQEAIAARQKAANTDDVRREAERHKQEVLRLKAEIYDLMHEKENRKGSAHNG